MKKLAGVKQINEGTELGNVRAQRGDIDVKQFSMGRDGGIGLQLTQGPGGNDRPGFIQVSREEAKQLADALSMWLEHGDDVNIGNVLDDESLDEDLTGDRLAAGNAATKRYGKTLTQTNQKPVTSEPSGTNEPLNVIKRGGWKALGGTIKPNKSGFTFDKKF